MLSYDIAVGCMKLMSNMAHDGFLEGLGISDTDFDRLTSDHHWLITEKNKMTVILDTLINASIEKLGIARFNLPAEYRAAGIVMFVKGINIQAACALLAQSRPAEDMGRALASDPCTAEQLFALVVQLYDSPHRTAAKAQFDKKIGIALQTNKIMAEDEPTRGKR